MFHYTIYRIKPDRLDQWKDWCDFLVQHKEEAIKTLREENILKEICRIYDNTYVLIGTVGKGESADLNVEINKKHQQNIRECLEPAEKQELYSFSLEE